MRPKVHVYCNILDNYGDIGVAYRLAKALALKDRYDVTLWFSKVPPILFSFADCPIELQIKVLTDLTPTIHGDLVVSTFSNQVPTQLKSINKYYLDLGYMSLDLRKSQYFPKTGRHSFHPGYLDGFVIGSPPAEPSGEYPTLRISWFSYKGELPEKLRFDLENYPREVTLFSHQLEAYKMGSLEIVPTPFFPQKTFDWLLSSCDVNFVRGEDSFVRSQLTSAVTIWQPYNRDAPAVTDRLQTTFVDRYTKAWPKHLSAYYEDFALHPDKTSIVPLLDNLPTLKPLCKDWKKYILELGDVSNVVHQHIRKFLNI